MLHLLFKNGKKRYLKRNIYIILLTLRLKKTIKIMKFDVTNGWFYSTTEKPNTKEYILRIYFKRELKHQQDIGYRPGETTVKTIIEKIKKGKK